MHDPDATYVARCDDHVFDLRVASDDNGRSRLVLDDLVELLSGGDGRLRSFGLHEGGECVVPFDQVAAMPPAKREALLLRRLRLVTLAGQLVGMRIDEALAAIAA